MKRYTLLYIVAALIAAFAAQPVQAQAVQDALYIYRNDGGFNAFFFDDIDHFEYSRIDTLGVEHDDYVVQEIFAMDSVFRIPVTAIDSIAFVTPDPVYQKDIIKIDKEITDYITASDTVNWIRLDSNTPENLIPKKGDKILVSRSNKLPEGFGGRVTNVEKTSAGTTITTEALRPEEAFEYAVFKMSASTELDNGTRTRADNPLIDSGPIELGPFIGVAGFTGSKDLINQLDIFSVSGTPLGIVRYEINPTLEIRTFFTIDKENGVHIANYANLDGHVNFHAKLEGTISARLDAPFPKAGSFARLTYNNPDDPVYFKGLVKTGLFAEAGAKIFVDGGFDGQFHASSSIGYKKPAGGEGQAICENNANFIENEYGVEYGFGDFTISLGTFFEIAIDLKHPLIKAFNGVGFRAELGDKVTVQAPALMDIPDDLYETYYGYVEGTTFYELLDKDDILKSDLYFSVDPYVKMYGWQSATTKRTINLLSGEWGVVPEVQVFRVYDEGIPYEVNAEYELTRELGAKCKVGLAVFNDVSDDNLEYEYWRPDPYKNLNDNTTVKQKFILDPVLNETVTYKIHPMATFLDKSLLHYECDIRKMEPAFINVPEKIELSDKEEDEDFIMSTNIPDVNFFTSANWIEDKWYQEANVLTLKHGEVPDNMDTRTATLFMEAKNSKGEVLIEREVPIIQKADPERIKFTVSPSTIDVPGYSTEFQNGSLTKQLTITYPRSATALHVSSSDESWLRADNGGGIGSGSNTCNVTIDGNASMKNPRKGTITVELTKADGTTEKKTVEVKQSALELKVEPKPGEVTLEAQEDEESKYSDKKIVKIEITPYDNFIASLIKNQEVTPNAEWIIPSISGSTVEIYAEANPVEEDRENTVTYKLTLTTGDVIERTIKVLQLALAGDPNIIDAGDLHFPAKGGDQTFTIDVPNVDRITDVTAYSGWIGVAGSGLKVTVLVKENDRPEARDGIFRVDVIMKDGKEGVLYYKVTQDAGVGFGEISSIDLSLKVAKITHYSGDEESYSGTYDRDATVSTDKGEITTSPRGSKGLHVDCNQTIVYGSTTWKYVVSFDIDDIYGLSEKTAKILNVNFHLTSDSSSSGSKDHGEEGIKIPSIPMNGENQWGGTAGGGIVFNNFVDKSSYVSYNDEGEILYSSSSSATLVDSPSNEVRIKLHFR